MCLVLTKNRRRSDRTVAFKATLPNGNSIFQDGKYEKGRITRSNRNSPELTDLERKESAIYRGIHVYTRLEYAKMWACKGRVIWEVAVDPKDWVADGDCTGCSPSIRNCRASVYTKVKSKKIVWEHDPYPEFVWLYDKDESELDLGLCDLLTVNGIVDEDPQRRVVIVMKKHKLVVSSKDYKGHVPSWWWCLALRKDKATVWNHAMRKLGYE